MPVMVTGTHNSIGDGAVRLLRAQGGEVRVFIEIPESNAPAGQTGPTWSPTDPQTVDMAQVYRGMGCKVARGSLDDEGHIETALEQVHTVLHLLGRPTDDPEAYLERTAVVITAAIGAGCRRLVLLSDLSVTTPAGNTWLEALADAEDMAADAPLESVILRCAVIHAPDDALTRALAAGALGSSPEGAHWPVAAPDVAATAVLADAQRQVDTRLHVQVGLTGPQRLTTAEYVAALALRLPAAPTDQLPDHARDLLTRTVDRPTDALGTQGRPLSEAW